LVPTVVVALLWMWMFNPEFGLLNWALGAVLGVIDAWTNLFFDLSAAPAGAGFLRPWAAALACLAAFGLLAPIALRSRPKLHAVVKNIAVVVMALAGIAVVNVALCYLLPVDMKKLHSPGWLSDGTPLPSGVPFAPPWALWALIMMSLWGVGQMAVIYLAKLQDVPAELYEAADIDGATWPQKTRHITIPMMSPVILFNVVMAIIGTFQVFTEPYIMTRGGPEDKTRFVAMFVYDQAFQYQRIGYASAVAWALFLLIVGLTLLAFYVSRKHVYYAGR
ncbi:MAG: sugar ABC transporter permease, partial [Planctomycetes bacterium]|nr:sugar ABC transporter permease [Planctomycetota bacterium]